MKNEKPDVTNERRAGRILIVDDDRDFALSLVDMLESRGYRVEVAHSSQSGREKAVLFEPQVALLDIRLGHDSGIDLIPHLKEARPEILCVMMTGYAAMDTAIEAIHRGAYDYLQKPLDMRYLLATLERCFEKLRLESEKAAAEKALQAYSKELEVMVAERTKELQEAREQLIRQEKLAMLGQLASGVAHELRNPLGVIYNAVYFLQMTLSGADEMTREYLEIIYNRAHEVEKIILDLFNLLRTRPAEREEITVSELSVEVLRSRQPPGNVKATTKIAANLPPVFVDPGQIRQVLANLVANAYQAMPEGGELTLSIQAEQERVHVAIADTGGGISPETMPKIFEPLFTTRAKGIGLGLAVSKNLVEINGGSIKVESTEGQGSTFTVSLPTREVLS